MAKALQNGGPDERIMAFDPRQLAWRRGAAFLLAAAASNAGAAAWANDAVGTLKPPCPRIASPAGQAYLQPARLKPDEVAAKNRLGCLSPADAIYGADGCPLRYCGANAGVFPFNPGSP
ncbi:MAG: hypothetical protein ACO23C_03460 [Prochlorococcaceae cyanobacterium]|jgi:hypothetical protein